MNTKYEDLLPRDRLLRAQDEYDGHVEAFNERMAKEGVQRMVSSTNKFNLCSFRMPFSCKPLDKVKHCPYVHFRERLVPVGADQHNSERSRKDSHDNRKKCNFDNVVHCLFACCSKTLQCGENGVKNHVKANGEGNKAYCTQDIKCWVRGHAIGVISSNQMATGVETPNEPILIVFSGALRVFNIIGRPPTWSHQTKLHRIMRK